MRGTATAVDGARLAWTREGDGPPLVLANGICNDDYQWSALRRALRGRASILSWDYRGHGASEPARDLRRLSIPDVVADLQAVMDAADIERAPLYGYSMGTQVVLEAWRHLPERISGLGLVLGCAGRGFEQMGGPALGAIAARTLRAAPLPVIAGHLWAGSALAPGVHTLARLLGIFERDLPYADFQGWYQQLRGVHIATFRELALALQAHDANDLLPSITVPTLVVSGGQDVFVRPAEGERVCQRIPGARLLLLPRASHAGLVGHQAQITPALVDLWEEVSRCG